MPLFERVPPVWAYVRNRHIKLVTQLSERVICKKNCKPASRPCSVCLGSGLNKFSYFR